MSQIQTLLRDRFGLTAEPFCSLPDGALIHWGGAHMRAHAAVEYGIMSGAAFIVLTGGPGSGKTSLLHHLVSRDADDLQFAMISGLRRGVGSVLPWILQALGETVAAEESETAILTRVQTLLIDAYAAGRHTVLLFDEAQNLSDDALDELRILSNINTAADRLVQIVLCGQDKLRDRLQGADLNGLAQRVTAWGHLDPMDRKTLGEYITTRMTAAGGSDDAFDAVALDRIFDATGGVPRSVNQLCDLALVYAMTSESGPIDGPAIQQVLADGLFVPLAKGAGQIDGTGRLQLAAG